MITLSSASLATKNHTAILIHLLNAVLKPLPERRVVSVEIINPANESEKQGDKLSILDIKARDQSGRYFDIEMQMTLHPSLAERLLYYISRVYGGQLVAGDNYDELRPTVGICFLDGRLQALDRRVHRHIQLLDAATQQVFSDCLEIHLFQTAKLCQVGG